MYDSFAEAAIASYATRLDIEVALIIRLKLILLP
jgi:hypothetical protein